MGQQVTYIRRKQDSECFNGEELERKIVRSFCPCSEMDYECDLGYVRNQQGLCVQIPDYEARLTNVLKQNKEA